MSSLIWFILGAIFGSFLNVCIHRLPRKESVIFPSSHCPACGTRLSFLDLIPILSYFLLRGKCRYCGAAISFRYPLVEFLTAAVFAGSWIYAQGNILDFVFHIIFLSLLLIIFFVDLEHQVIPDVLIALGILAGLIYNFSRGSFFPALVGVAIGFLLLYLIGWLGKIWFKKEVMGEGDWYLAAMVGAYLSWQGVLLSIFLAYFAAALVVVVLLVAGKVQMGQYVPFGPALAVGAIITLFWGEKIVEWYWGLFLL